MEIKQLSWTTTAFIVSLVGLLANDEAELALEKPSKQAITLAIKSRTYDPFGQNQDPNAKPKPDPSKITKKTLIAPKIEQPKVLLTQEIHKLKDEIKGIGVNRMIINNRFYRRGDTLDLTVANQDFKIQIVKISPTFVVFRNLKNNDLIDLDMKRKAVFDKNKPQGNFSIAPNKNNSTIDLNN